MKYFFLLIISLFFSFPLISQSDSIYNDDPNQYLPIGVEMAQYHYYADTGLANVEQYRIDPPFWWTDMKDTILSLMIYEKNIGTASVTINAPEHIELINTESVPNPNYKFLTIKIGAKAQPATIKINAFFNNRIKTYQYKILKRESKNNDKRGVDNSDLIYHIMPDRFANGDYSNDSYRDMAQKGINRDKMYFRHGGDIKGIIDHLGYIKDLGATAIWLTPVLENNQPYASYHGYAITDLYNIDKRYGTNNYYRLLVNNCHNYGLKVVNDMVLNHLGNENWLMKDIPDKNWIHQWPEFTKSNFRASAVFDPYKSQYDIKKLKEGWFDYSMPDLNQSNPLLAKYLIQNSIWWVEYAGIDDIRIDTWFFSDQDFLHDWVSAIKQEYPNMKLFGETWVQKVAIQSKFTANDNNTTEHAPNLPSVLDFQLNFSIDDALNKKADWTEGVTRLYYTLSQDFLYEDPYNNVIFLDNHDKARIFSTVGGDINKVKSALGLLFTLRGIPVLYYGTELLFDGDCKPDGNVRQDMPGGWKEDKVNKFIAEGRTAAENEIFNYIKTLAAYHRNYTALQTGKFLHFMPEDGIYVYFRYDVADSFMIIYNSNDENKKIKTDRYNEVLDKYNTAINIANNELYNDISEFELINNSILVLKLN
ncbi:MAG: glycoside hydrolase family 13 protein [Saprospiraceae bacterium]